MCRVGSIPAEPNVLDRYPPDVAVIDTQIDLHALTIAGADLTVAVLIAVREGNVQEARRELPHDIPGRTRRPGRRQPRDHQRPGARTARESLPADIAHKARNGRRVSRGAAAGSLGLTGAAHQQGRDRDVETALICTEVQQFAPS